MTKEETNKQSGIFLMEYDMIPTLASKTEVPTPHPCHNRSILIRIQLMIRWRLPNTIILTLVRFDVWTLSWIITLEVFQKKKRHHVLERCLSKYPPFPGHCAFQPSNQMARRNPRSVCTVGTVTVVATLLALAGPYAAFCNLRQAFWWVFTTSPARWVFPQTTIFVDENP